MNAIVLALYAVLRRFGILAGLAIIGTVAGGWSEWLSRAIDENAADATWLTSLWLLVEFVQKFYRESRKAPVAK